MKRPHLLLAALFTAMTFNVNAAGIKWALTSLPQNCLFNDFHDEIAVCYDTIVKKYGAIDTNGELIIPISYDYLSDFNGDCAIVRTAEGEGLINESNEFVFIPSVNWKISPIVTDNESASQPMKNSFLLVNEADQTQAIFYKDKLISSAPIHSISYDIQFPFIHIDLGKIINTETDEIISSIYDMGSYFLTENAENGSISAISHFTGEDITASVIGDEINIAEARDFAMSFSKDPSIAEQSADNTESAIRSTKNQFACSLSHENGIWKLTKADGEVTYSLKDEDGWTCKMPFYQSFLLWFERNIPNTDSTQIKIVHLTGYEYVTKTIKGSFHLKLFPSYLYVMGHTMISYSSPHICLTEVSPEGIETKTSIECIVRGATLLAKAKAAQNRKFASFTFEGADYFICGNFLMYKIAGNLVIYDIENDKKYPAKEIVDYSEDMILAKDPTGQYFAIQTNNGKKIALSKYQYISTFNEGVAIVSGKAGKAVIDLQGKILAQDSKDLSIISSQSSENVIVARNNQTKHIGFMYNPLVTDTLIYNTDKKVEQLRARGNAYMAKKQYNNAKQCFKKLCKHDAKDVDAIVKYADCMTAQKYYAPAISYYNRALQIDPSNKEASQHLEIAQRKKEQAEYAAEMTRAICGAIYEGLSAANDALASSQSYSSSSSASSGSSSSAGASGSGGSYRNDTNYRNNMMKTYADYENQLSKMNTYPETYNDSDRRYIQSRMKSIRKELESRGYTQRHSVWEDWDGSRR